MLFTDRYLKLPRYELLLICAAAIWGLGTVVIKDILDSIPPFWLVGIRFFSAGTLLSLVIGPRMRRHLNASHLKAGAFLGVLLALTYLLNTTGLAFTTASNSSFLTATYCVFVPFLAWIIIRQRPSFLNIAAALTCIAGVGLVALPTVGPITVNLGDGLTLLSSVACGLHIVFVARLAKGRNVIVLTAVQFLTAGAIALILAGVTTEPPSVSAFGGEELGSLLYLIVCATCATLLMQNIAITHVKPAQASLLLSTEAVFGAAFSVALLGEALTLQAVTGFALIFAAILISECLPHLVPARKRRKAGVRYDSVSEEMNAYATGGRPQREE